MQEISGEHPNDFLKQVMEITRADLLDPQLEARKSRAGDVQGNGSLVSSNYVILKLKTEKQARHSRVTALVLRTADCSSFRDLLGMIQQTSILGRKGSRKPVDLPGQFP